MAARKKPVEITRDNIDGFMQQFDTMLCDCDGVLWFAQPLPNAKEALECLRQAGKKVLYVTNNNLQSPEAKLKKYGFPLHEKDGFAFPPLGILHHLQNIGFDKTAFAICSTHERELLQSHGVKLLPPGKASDLVEESVFGILSAVKLDPEVGAVIFDTDAHMSVLDVFRAVNYLQRPDCLFIAGATDTQFPIVDGKVFVGPGHFMKLIEEVSGRKVTTLCGKPGPSMVTEYLKPVHNLDLKRTVFVGDSLMTDMGMADACGMIKLMVLTGSTTTDDMDTCAPELIPDYYINAIGDFVDLLSPK